MNHEEHVHPCGHVCACALPGAPKCVQDAIELEPTTSGRQAIWAERWPAEHPHDQNWRHQEDGMLLYEGSQLPRQHHVEPSS